jgi:hypothetical protein
LVELWIAWPEGFRAARAVPIQRLSGSSCRDLPSPICRPRTQALREVDPPKPFPDSDAALTADLDPNSAALVRRILEYIAAP